MARKRYQQGALEQSGSRRPAWVLRWREDVLESDGCTVRRVERRATVGLVEDLPTRRAARRAADLFLARAGINGAGYRPRRRATFGEFAAAWERDVLIAQKHSSAHAVRGHLSKWLRPAFAAVPLPDLGTPLVQQLVARMSAAGRQPKTIANVIGTLSSICGTARRWGYDVAAWAPGDLVLPTDRRPRTPTVFAPEDVARILAVASPAERALLATVAITGMRIGEVLGLRWCDVDTAGGVIWIRQNVVRKRITTPKTETSAQTVPLPPAFADELAAYARATGADRDPQRLLWRTRRGLPWDCGKLVVRVLHPLLQRAGYPKAGFHAFRHSLASHLPSAGAAPAVVQRQLRHADPRVTLAIYSHAIGSEHRAAIETIAARVLRADAGDSDGKAQRLQ